MFKNRNYKTLLLVILLALSLMLISSACSTTEEQPTTQPEQPQVQQISEEEVLMQAAIDYFNYLPANSNLTFVDPAKSDLVENLENYYVIDIRREDAYSQGHIPGSVNIPMASLGQEIPNLPKDKTLVLVCYTGRTGNQSAAVLKMAGFDAIALRGGHAEWADAGLPLEK